MKKRNLKSLKLNKTRISNLKKGGMKEHPASPGTLIECAHSGLCATGAQCELDSFLCTNFKCATTIFPLC
ncbi:MAG: hypothetical protein AAF611_18205 [Bacteroidota bacterium]